jgi:hypothetical protein
MSTGVGSSENNTRREEICCQYLRALLEGGSEAETSWRPDDRNVIEETGDVV